MKKVLVLISAVFLVVLAAAELYVQSDLFANRLRPSVLGPLTKVLGSEARIGWIRANLIPLYVEARDISLPDAAGRQAVAIRKIKAYINPLALLFKRVRLSSVVVLEPRITAARSDEGSLNLQLIIDRIRGNIVRLQSHGGSGFKVTLNSLALSQGRISFQDAATGTRIELSDVYATGRVNLPENNLNGGIKHAEVRISAPAYPELAGILRSSLRYDNGKLHVDALELSTADTTVSLSGSVGSLPARELDLRLKLRSGPQTVGRFTKLLKQLKREQTSHLLATASARGPLTDPSIDGLVQLTGVSYHGIWLRDAGLSFNYRNNRLDIKGERWKLSRAAKSIDVESIEVSLGYSARGFDIERFHVAAGDLDVNLSGRTDPQRGFDAVLTAESRGNGQALSFLTTIPLEGSISVKGSLTGALNEPLFDGMCSAGPLSVRGILFDTAAGRLQYRDKRLSLVSVDIHRQSARYFFNGSVDLTAQDPVFSARLKVIKSDVGGIVALFYRPLPLYFAASGDLAFNGTIHDFSGTGRLAVDAGSAYGESFTKGMITANLTTNRIEFPEVVVEKGSGVVQGTGWIGFDKTYSAEVRSHGVRLKEVNLLSAVPLDGAFDLSIASSGSFTLPQVSSSLHVDELAVNQAALGGMQADLHIRDHILTCRSSLTGERAVLTGRLALSKPFAWSGRAVVKADLFDPFLIFANTELMGRVKMIADGSLSLRGNGMDMSSLAGTLLFERLGLVVGDYRIDNNGPSSISVRGDRLTISSLNLSGQGTKMAVSGTTRFRKDVDLSFLGTANLSLLRPIFPDLEYSDGNAEVKLMVRETWNEPDITGELLVRNGEIKIKDVPQKFSALSGKVTFDRGRIVIDSLTGAIGGGTLNGSGNATLAGIKLQDFATRIAFENVSVRYPEGLTSTLSGDLYYDGDSQDQSLTGDIAIRRARYEKRIEWKSMLVDIGKGLYQKKKTEGGWIGDTRINLRFSGRENILFQNNLAKIPLDVDVFLRGTVSRPQLLGRIEARRGSVYFRQNEFKILHGSVDFVDPNRINPILDIQAEIQVREYLVRLAVSGNADHAVVTLLSDPSLPDSDILALLALGRTGTELKGKEAGVGMSEAASFATGKFQDLFESRARSLTGLDRFQVDPYVSKGDTSVPRVTVGKEIVQDKLYVTYSSNVGATTPEQIFRIEYILNKHFSVVGERNELGNTGADIKYRFEFK